MVQSIIVDIADQKIARSPDKLITYALGSCVGVSLYDPLLKIGGLAHIFLPHAFGEPKQEELFKFADTAVAVLIKSLKKSGCNVIRLTAKIAGGANMFASQTISIGEKNIFVVKSELNRFGIKIKAEDTGKNYGRTMIFDPSNGSVMIKSVGKEIKII